MNEREIDQYRAAVETAKKRGWITFKPPMTRKEIHEACYHKERPNIFRNGFKKG